MVTLHEIDVINSRTQARPQAPRAVLRMHVQCVMRGREPFVARACTLLQSTVRDLRSSGTCLRPARQHACKLVLLELAWCSLFMLT